MNEPQYKGNIDLLARRLTGFLASRTVQTDKVLACYDWATSLDPATDCVVGGFQSSMERDVLHFLLRSKIPVVIVLARRFYKDITPELTQPFNDGRVLFVSLTNLFRTTRPNAILRNRYVADVSSTIVFGMLSRESSLFQIYEDVKKTNKSVTVIDPLSLQSKTT